MQLKVPILTFLHGSFSGDGRAGIGIWVGKWGVVLEIFGYVECSALWMNLCENRLVGILSVCVKTHLRLAFPK